MAKRNKKMRVAGHDGGSQMKGLPVWEIVLPVNDNAGKSTTWTHQKWQKGVLEIAGGYTMRPRGDGAWRDASGKVYNDEMIPYKIACELPEFARIVEYAFRLFPDQVAIYTEHAGYAAIIGRVETFNQAAWVQRSLALAYLEKE